MTTNGNGNGSATVGTSKVKQGLAQMLKGGVIVSSIRIVFCRRYQILGKFESHISCFDFPLDGCHERGTSKDC